jgi:hypothetical protein
MLLNCSKINDIDTILVATPVCRICWTYLLKITFFLMTAMAHMPASACIGLAANATPRTWTITTITTTMRFHFIMQQLLQYFSIATVRYGNMSFSQFILHPPFGKSPMIFRFFSTTIQIFWKYHMQFPTIASSHIFHSPMDAQLFQLMAHMLNIQSTVVRIIVRYRYRILALG